MVAISRDLEAVLAFSPDAAQMHELADTLLAYPDAPRPQLLPCARPTTGAVSFSADNLGVDQQRIVAEVARTRRAGASHEVLVVPGHAPLQDQTLDRDGPHAMVATNEGVLQLCAFAKYAVAFPRMSRSIFTRANSTRSRLISICSALMTFVSTPLSWPSRSALTQLNSV